MATPHIESRKEDIADIVLMPGDPLRAKLIAEKYLTDAKLVNNVRGMSAYTGYYKDKRVTVFPSGMGIPSMGIYSYELYKFYDVKKIIRIGTMGAYTEELNLYDLVLVNNSFSKSNYTVDLNGKKEHGVSVNNDNLSKKILEYAKNNNIKLRYSDVYCTEVFYGETMDMDEMKYVSSRFDCIGTEMESYALFCNANYLDREAACLLTVSDNLITKEETTSEEREKGLDEMILLALNSII